MMNGFPCLRAAVCICARTAQHYAIILAGCNCSLPRTWYSRTTLTSHVNGHTTLIGVAATARWNEVYAITSNRTEQRGYTAAYKLELHLQEHTTSIVSDALCDVRRNVNQIVLRCNAAVPSTRTHARTRQLRQLIRTASTGATVCDSIRAFIHLPLAVHDHTPPSLHTPAAPNYLH